MDNVTSVVIPVCEEYKVIKEGTKPNKKIGIEGQTQDIKQKILGSGYSRATKQNIIRIYEEVGTEIFGNSRIVEILDCSETTATTYINRMYEELQITVMVEGAGKGKYRFIV